MGTRLENKKKTFKLIVALLSPAATLIWVLFFAWMLCQNSTSSEILELAEGLAGQCKRTSVSEGGHTGGIQVLTFTGGGMRSS